MKMKATGIVRKVDELGRLVLPIELRRTMGIDIKDPVEVFVDGDRIVLQKYQPGCVICGSCDKARTIRTIKGKVICDDCAEVIAQDLLE